MARGNDTQNMQYILYVAANFLSMLCNMFLPFSFLVIGHSFLSTKPESLN